MTSVENTCSICGSNFIVDKSVAKSDLCCTPGACLKSTSKQFAVEFSADLRRSAPRCRLQERDLAYRLIDVWFIYREIIRGDVS